MCSWPVRSRSSSARSASRPQPLAVVTGTIWSPPSRSRSLPLRPLLRVRRTLTCRSCAQDAVLVASGTAALLGAAVVLLSGAVHGDALAGWVALLAAAIVVAFVWRDGNIAVPVVSIGTAVLGVAVLAVIGPIVTAIARPFAWTDRAWTAGTSLRLRDHLAPHAHVVVAHGLLPGWILAVAAFAVLARAAAPRQSKPMEVGGLGAALLGASAAYLLVASGAPAAWLAVASSAFSVSALAVAVVAARRRALPGVRAGAAAAIVGGLPAVAVSVAVHSVAIGTSAAAAVACTAAALGTRPSRFRTILVTGAGAAAYTCVGASFASFATERSAVGLAIVITGSAVLATVSVLWRTGGDARGAASVTAHLAVGAGIALCSGTLARVAVGLTVLAAAHAIAAVRSVPYRVGGAASAVAATWAWLAVAQVHLPEAYTLPAAAAMLAAGLLATRTRPAPSSWFAFGPGLLVAFAPTLALVVERVEAVRAVPLTGAALVVVLAGARARVQAPVVLGATTLVALGIDIVAPVAARGPRWIALAIAGVALLWLGATAERRLTQARAWTQAFGAFR